MFMNPKLKLVFLLLPYVGCVGSFEVGTATNLVSKLSLLTCILLHIYTSYSILYIKHYSQQLLFFSFTSLYIDSGWFYIIWIS